MGPVGTFPSSVKTEEHFQVQRPPVGAELLPNLPQQHADMSSTFPERSCGVTMATENTTGMLKR